MACVALWAAQWLPAAEAHAELLSSYPAPGARLNATPTEIRLTFSERIGAGSSVKLFGPNFRPVSGVPSGPDPAAPEQLRAFPPQLTPDIYTVEWDVASLDGHAVSGSYAFEVTATPAARLPAWLLVGGLPAVLVLGGIVFWAVARRQRPRDAAGSVSHPGEANP
jgi:methionine-rich copper-binding protein CopC